MTCILAIDPATKTGFARYEFGSGELVSDVVTFDKDIWAFSRQYRHWLTKQIQRKSVTHILIESAILPQGQTNITTLKKAYALNVHTHEIGHSLGCEVKEVQVSQWRKHFLCGRTPPKESQKAGERSKWYKQAVMDRCKELGWAVRDNNEADALGILDFARSQIDPTYAANSTPLFAGAGS